MKRAVTCVVLIVLVVGMGIASVFITSAKCKDIKSLAEGIGDAIKSKEPDLAKEKTKQLNERWTKDKRVLIIFLRRTKIDEISSQISRLNGWIEMDDDTDSVAALTTINDLSEDLAKEEIPTFLNIL